MKRFNINLPDELYEKLRKKAFEQKMSVSSIIVFALSPKQFPVDTSTNTVDFNKVKEVFKIPGVVKASSLLDPEKYCRHLKKNKDCGVCNEM